MVILAIETSCDDTCAALIKANCKKRPSFEILSNIVSSQVKLHAKYGGVYPSLAKREHQRNLPKVLAKALANGKNPKIDLIAVTVGPGLEPCLWQGVNFAKELARKLKLPIVPVNHIEAHIFANLITRPGLVEGFSTGRPGLVIRFPAICLVVSGGHTQLILMKGFGDYKILGETRDDAAGECFDKTARILGLGYPGGPAIAKQAVQPCRKDIPAEYRGRTSIKLPRPMIYQKNYDFSFSGLKTAVLYDFKSRPPKVRTSKEYIQKMATEIQQAIIDVLIHKTLKAAKNLKAKTIILGGGVAANEELRKQFKSNVKCQVSNVKFLVPPKNLCTDNAAMTAVTGYFHFLKKKTPKENLRFPTGQGWKKIKADANLRIENSL